LNALATKTEGKKQGKLQNEFPDPNHAEYHPKAIAEVGQNMMVTLNGRSQAIQSGERLIDLINRCGVEVPHVCYHPNSARSNPATPAWWRSTGS
jgi:hypothetical protein